MLPDWFGAGARDPWLTKRMRRVALIDVTERRIGEGVERAMALFLQLARDGVLGRNTPPSLVAAAEPGEDEPPDLSGWPTAAEWDAFVAEFILPPVSAAFGEAFAAEIRRGVASSGPYATAYLVEVHDRLKIWPDGAFEEIRLELLEGIESGESIPQLRDRIGRVLNIDALSREFEARARELEKIINDPDADPADVARARAQRAALFEAKDQEDSRWRWKAERIARTETIGALNGGTLAGGQTWATLSGEEMHKQWWATRDNRVRSSHWAVHMRVVALDEQFTVGGYALDGPGDPNGPGQEVINCRCTLLILDAAEAAAESVRYAEHRPTRTDIDGRPIDDNGRPLVAAATTEDDDMTAPTTPAPGRLPSGWRGTLAPIGVRSGDDRLLAVPRELSTRELPLPLLYQESLAPGHDGAIGGLMNITRAWIENGRVMGEGKFDVTDPRALDIIRKIEGGFLRWVSVDLDHTMSEMRCYLGADEVECAEEGVDQGVDPTELPVDIIMPASLDGNRWRLFGLGRRTVPLTASAWEENVMAVEVATEWRLMGATLVTQPAFQEAYIELVYDDDPAETAPEEGDPTAALAHPEYPLFALAYEALAERARGILDRGPIQVRRGGMIWPADAERMAAEVLQSLAVSGDGELPLADPDREWDGPAAASRVLAWAAGDADKMGRAFFYRDPEVDPATEAAYKLGYADVVDGDLVAIPRGIYTVANVLEGGQGGVDIPEGDRGPIRVAVGRWYDRMAEEFEDPAITPPWAPAALLAAGGFVTEERLRESLALQPHASIAVGGKLSELGSTLATREPDPREVMIIRGDDVAVVRDPGAHGRRRGPRSGSLSAFAHQLAAGDPAEWDLGQLPILMRPPAAWFVDPEFTGPTALTITDDGRVFGHLGLYKGSDSCHVGFRGRCVPPPPNTNFARFNNRSGSLRVAEGYDIACGKLVLGTTHASTDPRVSAAEAEAHYANTGFGAARGRAGTDAWGQWFVGSLMPGTPAEHVEVLRSSTMSGDWREINGEPYLIAVLTVNVQGFSVPRMTTGDDGRILALTAAGVIRPLPDRPTVPEVATTVSVTAMTPASFAEALYSEGLARDRRAREARALAQRIMGPRINILAERFRPVV